MNHTFTLKKGLEVQHKQLMEWKEKLNDECYAHLAAAVEKDNNMLKDTCTGYDVMRGSDLDMIVANWKPELPLPVFESGDVFKNTYLTLVIIRTHDNLYQLAGNCKLIGDLYSDKPRTYEEMQEHLRYLQAKKIGRLAVDLLTNYEN